MAEFLVYNTDHWMDSVPEKVREKWNDKMLAKYYARHQKGDIVEVYPDGTCKEKPSSNCKFVIVKVPGLSFKDAKHLINPDVQITERVESVKNPKGGEDFIYTVRNTGIVRRRRYRINPELIDTPTKEVNMNNSTFQLLISDKKIG